MKNNEQYVVIGDYIFFLKGFLSQWYPSEFCVDGATYNCAEQWMMAKKAMLFGDVNSLINIMANKSPLKQKAIGRKVCGFDPDVWNRECEDIVYRGSYEKFVQNPMLWARLLHTGDKMLVEANPKDSIWGIGYSAEKAMSNINSWGLNKLGKILTRVREQIRNET